MKIFYFKIFTYISTLLIVLLFVASCSHSSENPILVHIDTLSESQPDSALILYNQIHPSNLLHPEDRVYYGLLKAKVYDKNELSLLPCDTVLNEAIRYYGDKDKKKAVALLYKGRLEAEMGDLKAAIDLSLRSMDILTQYPNERTLRLLILSSLGTWYTYNGMYALALKATVESLQYARNTVDTCAAYNTLSFVYAFKGDSDSTIYYQRLSTSAAENTDNMELKIKSWHSLSTRYKYFGRCDSAFYYAQNVLRYAHPQAEDYAYYLYNMGDLYTEKDMCDSARYYLEQSMNIRPSNAAIYLALAELEKKAGNYKSAYDYLDLFSDIQDSILIEDKSKGIQQLVYQHQSEMAMNELKRKEEKKEWLIISAAISLLLAAGIIIRHRMDVKHRQYLLEQQALRNAHEKISDLQEHIMENENLIANIKRNETDKQCEIAQCQELIRKLKEEKQTLRLRLFQQDPIYSKVMAYANQMSITKKERKILPVTDQKKLRQTVNEIFAEYIREKKEEHPKLTDDDIFVLCLEEAKFSPLTIAICTGHTDTLALNQRKLRIRSKLL